MASFSSFNAARVSQKFILVLVLLAILLVGPSAATSRAYTTMQPKHHQKKYDAGLNNPDSLRTMLPKGKPVPPSGPSKRHN
ncbi:hypothetical protein HanRHA438_Chr16g0784111 [Helianthus annuus]|nr:hypothetical protein HanRHA438_Chr16g0784111 [Helianthus annuus]